MMMPLLLGVALSVGVPAHIDTEDSLAAIGLIDGEARLNTTRLLDLTDLDPTSPRGRALERELFARRVSQTARIGEAIAQLGGPSGRPLEACYDDAPCEVLWQARSAVRAAGGYARFQSCLREAIPVFEAFRATLDFVGAEVGYQWPEMPERELAARLLASRYRDQVPRIAVLPGSRLLTTVQSNCLPVLRFLISSQGELWDRQQAPLVVELASSSWPTISQVGEEASGAATLLAQHASHDPLLQLRALRAMEPLVAQREIRLQDYALLYDRVHFALFGEQRFGTQVLCDGDDLRLAPVENAAGLDERRRSMGLAPIADYLSQMRRRCVVSTAPPPPSITAGASADRS